MSSNKITTGTKEDGKPALLPKLRFPEFRGSEGWTEKALQAAAQINPANDGLPESFIYIDLESVDAGELKSKTRISRNGAPSRAQRLVEQGDIIYQVVRPYQRNNLLCEFDDDENYVASTGYAQLRARGSNRFLYQSIHTDSFVGRVIAKCTGSNYPAINSSDLAEIELPLPPTLAEQQKIAECLSSADEVIAAQARKVDALKTYKKGLMQQLFPRAGETQPRLRFPEFRGMGKWEEVPLGEIAAIKLGKMLNKQKHTPGRLLPYLNNLAVRWNEVNTSNLPEMYFDDNELDRFGLKAGDVVVCEGGEPGRAAVWDGRLPDLKFQKAIHRVRFKVPFEPKLLVLHLENLAGTTQFEMLFTGGGIKHLTRETFAQLKVPLIPPPEQQRIAGCLSSLDALITAATQKLEALQRHKRGLMQQLFPSPEEAEA